MDGRSRRVATVRALLPVDVLPPSARGTENQPDRTPRAPALRTTRGCCLCRLARLAATLSAQPRPSHGPWGRCLYHHVAWATGAPSPTSSMPYHGCATVDATMPYHAIQVLEDLQRPGSPIVFRGEDGAVRFVITKSGLAHHKAWHRPPFSKWRHHLDVRLFSEDPSTDRRWLLGVST